MNAWDRPARRRGLAALSLAVAICSICASSATAGGPSPVLAGPWGLHQRGYGHVKPVTIFNGGDPTGLVQHIHWISWGGPQAVGAGIAEYVGPHQIVAEGSQEIAKIVLFHLGHCHGRRAYDAIEWYFPQHGERFEARRYIGACTGTYFPR
jgi:hypothetical protein